MRQSRITEAQTIVSYDLKDERAKIAKLTRLEKELERMSQHSDVHCEAT